MLFAQHGWADTHRPIQSLAAQLAPHAPIIAPNLGWLRTWWRIAPLIDHVEAIAQATREQYPQMPWRLVGHSMGGLIWLEVLHRHPDWWPMVHSLVLVASPVGGAIWGQRLDPYGWGIGIARDLAMDRREIAMRIARKIPVLSVAGDLGDGSDGTVRVTTTQFPGATLLNLPYSHPALKKHPALIPVIQEFWAVGAIAG
ncbi:MAG: alpha/beta hydrolase [Spirulina sp. SIO3F2]|nr:alpha/beta hydrolase [Spirulina sp. SIO3F2]